LKRNDSPSPTTYKDVDTKWKQQSNHPRAQNFTISKEARKSYLDIVQKNKAKIPGVGSYAADDMKKYALISKGTSMPRYKQGR